MNHFFTTVALAALTVGAAGTVEAAKPVIPTVVYPDWPMYLGDYWPGEKVNFTSRDLFTRDGPNALFQEAWVFDVNNTATVTFTVTSTALTAPPANHSGGYFLVLYPDNGSVCYPDGCNVQLDPTVLASLTLPEYTPIPRRTSLRVEGLVPGRYLLVLRGHTGATAGHYTGQVTFR